LYDWSVGQSVRTSATRCLAQRVTFPTPSTLKQERCPDGSVYQTRDSDGTRRGRRVDDPDAAREKFEAEWEHTSAGYRRRRSHEREGLTLGDLCNYFLTHKKSLIASDELTLRSWNDYKHTTDRLIRVFGAGRPVDDLSGDDFAKLRADITKTRGPVATKTEIIRTKSVFHFGFKHNLIEQPVRFGAGFDPPSRKTIRKAANGHGSKMFEPAELRAIIDACTSPALKAMVLIAANSGMGNHDVGLLTFENVDLERGWIDFPREKTGTPRRFPLWPETIEAIKTWLAKRPKPRPGHEEYVFVTRKRECWSKDSTRGVLSREFRKVLAKVGIKRKGGGFYDLRRSFQTVGEEAGEVATRFIMGHVDGSMSARYRQRIADHRLQRVVDHVHDWLWPPEDEAEREGGDQ